MVHNRITHLHSRSNIFRLRQMRPIVLDTFEQQGADPIRRLLQGLENLGMSETAQITMRLIQTILDIVFRCIPFQQRISESPDI